VLCVLNVMENDHKSSQLVCFSRKVQKEDEYCFPIGRQPRPMAVVHVPEPILTVFNWLLG
jgi:hypothetical protein